MIVRVASGAHDSSWEWLLADTSRYRVARIRPEMPGYGTAMAAQVPWLVIAPGAKSTARAFSSWSSAMRYVRRRTQLSPGARDVSG